MSVLPVTPPDEAIDLSDIPELSAAFFEGAVLTLPGEGLIESVRADALRFAAGFGGGLGLPE